MNITCSDKKSYNISNLPTVPHLLVELLNLCHQEDAGFDKFAEMIGKDTGLTSRVMHIANTPAFRQWNDVSDLRRFLIVLGMHNLKTIVTTSAIEQFFYQFSSAFNHQLRQIWVRSICCANLCERLARLLNYHKPGEAFFAGLLHQSGMLILMMNDCDNYLQLLDSYYETPYSFCEQERALLQIDHCELGALLAQSWKLDSFIADAIQFQRAPTDELRSAPTLIKILAVAARFTGSRKPDDNPTALARATELLGLTSETALTCLHEALDKSIAMLTALSIPDAASLINQQQESGLLSEDKKSAPQLREAVRRVALSRAAAPGLSKDMITFAKQVRISFCSVFPLQQLLLLRYDEKKNCVIPINDLGLHQLEDLVWEESDNKSQIIAALNSGREETLTTDGSTIADRQLLRLLDSTTATLIPLIDQNTKIGVIALGLGREKSPLAATDKALLSLFCEEVARRHAALNKTLDNSLGMGANRFRQLVHEISNPLSIINNYLYVLGKKLHQEDAAQEELRTISEEIERIGRILLHARENTSGVISSQDITNINELISELDRILKNSLYTSGHIQSVLQLDRTLPPVRCSADKLKQVLINLLKNAAEVLEFGGTIQVFTRDNIFQDQQRLVEITVKDNGPGITPTILQNLFTPVVSTKEGHSGLGLVVVNTLVKEMGGSISCFSSPATGTEFKILLPREIA
ncbi:MAG: HDOD domain-containing protein [Desulfuromonadales bacterium]|nr:HDOD domain-containing protein [Desulfuromonadales bacterium]